MAKTLSVDDHVCDNKDIVFDIMEKEGIPSFEVDFDGSNDSGQMESVSLDNKLLKKKMKGCKVRNGTRWDPKTNTSTPVWENDVSLHKIIEGVCYDVLEQNFGGWEINDGSHGTFTFSLVGRLCE